MALALVPSTGHLRAAVLDLNQRLLAGGMAEAFLLPEHESLVAAAPGPERLHWLVQDGDVVRGGILLQEQPFLVNGELHAVANCQTPVSEGSVDKRYAHIAGFMMKKLQVRQPRLFAVGMGSDELPFPRLVKALGWQIRPVPFFFRVCRPAPFLRNIGLLRTTALKRMAASAVAASGFGALAIHSVQRARRRPVPLLSSMLLTNWDDWTDSIWENAACNYSFIARRQHQDLSKLLPIGQHDLLAWRLEETRRPVGWAAALVHRIPNSTYFGDMVVGTILDCLCLPGYESRVIATASKLVARAGADLLISNQLHRAWRTAFAAGGYFTSRSNYLLATSPELNSVDFETAHITRADGDGRVNL